MKNIKLLNSKNIEKCTSLLESDIDYSNYLSKLGWSYKQIRSYVEKKNNFSIGLWDFNKLVGFILGSLIFIEKKSEYEILLIYVSKYFRKRGYASYLINSLINSNYLYPLKKISLEVSENNFSAINFYKKNGFKKVGIRNQYYVLSNLKKENALIFEKITND